MTYPSTTLSSPIVAYLDSLIPPSPEEFNKISQVQHGREVETRKKARKVRRESILPLPPPDTMSRPTSEQSSLRSQPRRKSIEAFRSRRAAKVIQRSYRGYRSRRESKGLELAASTRWVAAIQEAQFRETTKPRAREAMAPETGEAPTMLSREEDGKVHRGATARENWKKAAMIARRAGHDDADCDAESLTHMSLSSSSDANEEMAEKRKCREEATAKRKQDSQMMGLQYFLEMVDLKHRYGSNLRTYHEEWKKHDTNENFFYWLDYGEGQNIDMAACPRDRLEREQVRYLSREERQHYLVNIDEEGALCWAKNGERINTTEDYRDSICGIVPRDDPTPAWSTARDMPPTPEPEADANDSRSESSIESALEADRAAKYATPEVDDEKPHRKVMHVSASTIFNKMLRKSVRKNTWIFVADTNFRLYVGIKSSGAFQHSSFLQGSRISSAGLIKVKDGKIKSLSPLSGHYRPPTSNFRAFIRSLRESRVDVSHVSISKSYAVLVGLETYVRTRKKGKHVLQKMSLKKDKLVAPEAVARREEEERDKSESAAREREILEAEAAREQREREEKSAAVKLMRKLHIATTEDGDENDASTGNNAQQSAGNQVDEGHVSTRGGAAARTPAAA
ncbi:hypothetical protein VDGD_01056 [Verticillium dahliae]|nr:hypothetical protein VDGD_01056 [Verticillium dahliae]